MGGYNCTNIDLTEWNVLQALIKWSDEECWYGYSRLSDETGISVKELKSIMKKLRGDNIVLYDTTVNADGQINGKGYFINQFWLREVSKPTTPTPQGKEPTK